jgi:uncharacterized protein (TIGR03083 family)
MTTAATTIHQPLTPQLDRKVAMRLAATEYGRFLDLLRSLDAADWAQPTRCAPWDVRQLSTHLLGMVELAASVREQNRQTKAASARREQHGGLFIDALTGLQVDERADWTPRQIIDRFAARAPKAVKGRKRAPGFIRRRTMPVQQDVNGRKESWTIGYMLDVILTRDPWMHRVDIVDATGAELVLTRDHDGVIVADVVAEWAARHGQPYELHLTGPAGGEWRHGAGGPKITMDAVEFCRAISERTPANGLLSTQVPF